LDSEGYDDSLIAMLLTPIQRGKHMQIAGNGRIQIRLHSLAKDGSDINDEWKAVAGEAYMHSMTGMVHSYLGEWAIASHGMSESSLIFYILKF